MHNGVAERQQKRGRAVRLRGALRSSGLRPSSGTSPSSHCSTHEARLSRRPSIRPSVRPSPSNNNCRMEAAKEAERPAPLSVCPLLFPPRLGFPPPPHAHAAAAAACFDIFPAKARHRIQWKEKEGKRRKFFCSLDLSLSLFPPFHVPCILLIAQLQHSTCCFCMPRKKERKNETYSILLQHAT